MSNMNIELSNMQNWQKKHMENEQMANMMSYSGINSSFTNAIYQYNNNLIGDYNIFDEEEPNQENYSKKMSSLAEEEISLKDLNNDSVLTDEEVYGNNESLGVINDYSLFLIIDQVMGNNDGVVDDEELGTYYTHLDEFNQDSNTPDGIIEYKNIEKYSDYLVNQVTSANYSKLEEWKNNLEDSGSYDFMDGYNPNDYEAYDKQTNRLGQTTIEAFDLNNDGKITKDEYSKEVFDLDFEDLDYMNKGYLDKYNFGAYWELIDTHDADGKNGKITISFEEEQ